MELLGAQQIPSDELYKTRFNLFLIASGYEKRSVFLLEKFKIKADMKIALAYIEKSKELHRKENQKIILANGFEILPVSGEEGFEFQSIIKRIFPATENNTIKILVDYSSMTKVWYSTIITSLMTLSSAIDQIEIYFSYTPAAFSEPRKQKSARLTQSLFYDVNKKMDPSKPIALIIGLGLDNSRSETLVKKIKPAVTYLLYTDPAHHINYFEQLFKNNQKLIESIEIRNLYNYPFKDLRKTNEILTNLCLDLRLKYNIIIAPVGPKVFALIAMLLATRYPDLDVWRVSGGIYEKIIDKIPDGDPLIYKVDFVSDEL